MSYLSIIDRSFQIAFIETDTLKIDGKANMGADMGADMNIVVQKEHLLLPLPSHLTIQLLLDPQMDPLDIAFFE